MSAPSFYPTLTPPRADIGPLQGVLAHWRGTNPCVPRSAPGGTTSRRISPLKRAGLLVATLSERRSLKHPGGDDGER